MRCPGHKRKNGLTSGLYSSASRVLDAHPRDRVLGSITDAFSTQFTGFFICHPMYDDKHMRKVVQHATTSALNNQEATATFLLLPYWMENSTNAFYITCTDNRDVCTILISIPKTKVCYIHSSQQAKHHPCQKQHHVGACAS